MTRHLLLLAFCQSMFMTNNITFIAVNGLAGLALAPVGWMATLPITSYVIGSALSAPLVARLQSQWGRKRSFQLGLVMAAVSAGACAYAMSQKNFGLLMLATLLAGFYQANAALYRFAGTEVVEPSYKEKAISWVLAGGIVGALIGPNLANASVDLLPVRYAGAYLALIGVAAVAFVALSFIQFPPHKAPAPGASSGRPLAEIARQPTFIVAVAAGALGYGVMNLLMAATPLAMQ
ncbi:MAG: MFS transporter, partial [Betaproteobacteria bacterium]